MQKGSLSDPTLNYGAIRPYPLTVFVTVRGEVGQVTDAYKDMHRLKTPLFNENRANHCIVTYFFGVAILPRNPKNEGSQVMIVEVA